MIERKYNVDEIGQRILNGDGGSWIKESYNREIYRRFDIYCTNERNRRNTECSKSSEKKAIKGIVPVFSEF